MTPTPTLHMLCGKIAAGKSTLAAKLAEPDNTVLIVEDEWLHALFANELETPRDFLRYTTKLRAAMTSHIISLLRAGVSVVLDFQANTVESRAWMREIIDASGASHQLHVLVPPDDVCLARLAQRNASGEHQFTLTEEQFHQVSKHFVRPTADEGFALVLYD